MSHISVILVHFNKKEATLRCLYSLASLQKPLGVKFDVVVVDNGSKKVFKLPAFFASKKYHLIRSDSNLGFTGGNNMGIFYAIEKYNSDYLWLVNDDTTFKKDCLKQLYIAACTNNNWGLISPKIYFTPTKEFHKNSYNKDQKGRVFWFAGGVIDWSHLTAFHKGVDELDRGQFDQVSNTDFCTGCSLFMRREVLEKVGFFDKRYFLYFEDVDFSLKTLKAGYQLIFWPKAVVWHDNAGSSGGVGSKIQVYYQERNRTLLAWLYGDFKTKLLALRLQYQNLLSGVSFRRKAVFDFYLRQFGKQIII